MKYLSIILTLAGLLLFGGVLHAQTYFDDFLNDSGLSFKKPEGFTLKVVRENDENEFTCNCYNKDGSEDRVTGEFYLYNQDKSIIIQILNPGYDELKGTLVPYWFDDNKMFFNGAISKADTSKYPRRFYNADELKLLNADGAVEFTRNCNVPGNTGGFLSNRSIYISKAYQGNFYLTYLFKDTVRTVQDKIINDTKNMLTFSVDKKRTFSRAELSAKYNVDFEIKPILDTISTLWNRGSVYNNLFYFNREQYAVRNGDVVISIQFPVNHEWPYFNTQSKQVPQIFENNPKPNGGLGFSDQEKLVRANKDLKKYLTLAKAPPIGLTSQQLKILNADQGYLFDFEGLANDLYRGQYRKCKVILLHKNNLGTVLLKYYYLSGTKDVEKLISKTLGLVKFKDKSSVLNASTNINPF
jgi:hypothetical protein